MRERYSVLGTYYGEEIVFMDKTHAELCSEVARVRAAATTALALLLRIPRRHRHPALGSAVFQLSQIDTQRPIAGPGALSEELSSVTFILMDTLKILNHIKNCKLPLLERTRGVLLYGGAHLKKGIDDKKVKVQG